MPAVSCSLQQHLLVIRLTERFQVCTLVLLPCLHGESLAWAQDDDPYVRKTAAVCVAKLYDINPELVEDRGFLDALKVTSCLCCHQETFPHAWSGDTCIKFGRIHDWKCLV